MSANIFPCKHCRYPLGLCDENELIVGEVSFVQKTRVRCPQCGRMSQWRPTERQRDYRVDLGFKVVERGV